MSVRAIWVLSLSKVSENGGSILFCRRFPAIEKRLKVALGDDYKALPNDEEIVNGLYAELGLNQKQIQFDDSRDSCDRVDQKPVFEVTTSKGSVWPVLVVEQYGLLYCCLPYVVVKSETKPPLITISSLSLSFSLLLAIADFMGSTAANLTERSPKFTDLYLFLSEAAPFGSVCDTEVSSVTTKLNAKPPLVAFSARHIQPSWKPELYKGKSQISFTINEQMRAVVYNKLDIPDVFTLFGAIACKAEIEGQMPDVTINLTHGPTQSTPLDHLQTHPCVQSAESYILNEDAIKSGKAMPRKIRFSPPTESFTLCHYTATALTRLPITGAYHMKMDGQTANLEVKLYLNSDGMKNLFEYCELQLPFYNRGIIETHDSTCTTGSVTVSTDRTILIWNIGMRFPSKSPEIILASTVNFVIPRRPPANQYEDQFCVGQNAYAQLCFKINDFTLTGCHVDAKSLQISPASKFKLSTANSFQSAEYRIWNSHGEVLSAYTPLLS